MGPSAESCGNELTPTLPPIEFRRNLSRSVPLARLALECVAQKKLRL